MSEEGAYVYHTAFEDSWTGVPEHVASMLADAGMAERDGTGCFAVDGAHPDEVEEFMRDHGYDPGDDHDLVPAGMP